MLGSQMREERAPCELFRSDPVDPGKMLQRRALSVLGAVSYHPGELVSGPKVELLDHPSTDIDVFVAGSVRRFSAADET
jgi:hypothetical protein